MQATLIYGAVPFYDYGLGLVTELIEKTLEELDVSVNSIKLTELNLPTFEGRKNPEIQSIIEVLSKSEGIIFATTSQINNICSVMKTFIEYFEIDELKDCVSGKNCMIVTVADITGEKDAADYISKVIGRFSGNEAIRITIGGNMSHEIGSSDFIKEVVEKQVEDYYRIAKQNRKFIPSSESLGISLTPQISTIPYQTSAPLADMPAIPFDNTPTSEVKQLLHATGSSSKQNSGINHFNKKQEDDIANLAKLFERKISAINQPLDKQLDKSTSGNLNIPGTYKKPLVAGDSIVHRAKSCKQMTLSLPHYFQPQFAAGLNCTMQLSINGAEIFDCFLTIHGTECDIAEGITNEPDIIIISDSDTWQDCLRGKYSAQKAFMTGQLKVRGNFMLLNKFDVVFKKM